MMQFDMTAWVKASSILQRSRDPSDSLQKGTNEEVGIITDFVDEG